MDKLRLPDVQKENEYSALRLTWVILVGNAIIMITNVLLSYLHVYQYVEQKPVLIFTVIYCVSLDILAVYELAFHGRDNPIMKYLLITVMIFSATWLFYAYDIYVLIAAPMVLSGRYANRRFTVYTAAMTTVSYIASYFAYLKYLPPDLNYVPIPAGTQITVLEDFQSEISALPFDRSLYFNLVSVNELLPNLLFLSLVGVLVVFLTRYQSSVISSKEMTIKYEATVENQLSIASNIQTGMLPTDFAEFSNGKPFSIYATMDAASGVGGDFYDFFTIDENRIAFLVADVSGKGVPASLFMATCKTCLKDFAGVVNDLGLAFTYANHQICSVNREDMFATVWMGILNTSTGEMQVVNAGHNPPLLMHANGSFDYLRLKPQFILAGIDDYSYQYETLTLQPGDRLFLYTDGIPEANNEEGGFYGEDRLKDYLNLHRSEDSKVILKGLKKNIDDFAETAPQFDDITMLMLNYKAE